MAHRGMTKLRKIEKAGLIVLCVVMLVTLGLGTGSTCGGRGGGGGDDIAGTFEIAGEKFDVDRFDLHQYGSYLSFQNHVLRSPPTFKYARNLFGQMDPRFEDYDADEKDLWTFIILHRAALKAGVEVPPAAVEAWVTKFPWFQNEAGNFDRKRYLAFIDNAGIWATPLEFERMLTNYLAVEYYLGLYQPLLRPGSRQVYEAWKGRHNRHDIRYLVQDVAPIRAEIDPASLSHEDVLAYYERNEVRRRFLIPTKRTFEAVYVVPGQMEDEVYETLVAAAKEKKLVTVGPEEARQYYYANQDDYPLDPVREQSRKEWEAAHPTEDRSTEDKPTEDQPAEDGEDGDAENTHEDGEDGDAEDGAEDGDNDPAEDDEDSPPTVDADDGEKPVEEKPEATDEKVERWEDPAELDLWTRYDRFFKERVERELFTRKLLKRLLSDERISKAGLEAVAAFPGLTYFVTEAPLDQYEVLDVEVIGGPGLREALNRHGPETEGEYCADVQLNGAGDERAFFLYRVKSVIKEHYPTLEQEVPVTVLRDLVANMLLVPFGDVEKMNVHELLLKAFPDAVLDPATTPTMDTVVRLMLRQGKAEDRAAERLNVIREMVLTGAQTLDGAAKEKGYEVSTLTGLSESTRIPPKIEPEEGATLTPKQVEKNLLRARKEFLVRGWMSGKGGNLSRIGKTGSEEFVEGVLADKETDSAFLVYVTGHSTPGPEEMPEVESREIWLDLVNRTMRTRMQTFFSFSTVMVRYKLQVAGLTDRKPDAQ
jgi:hypothetical protein